MSIISDAFERRRQIRAEFDAYLEVRIAMAERDCRGYLLSKAGRRKGIQVLSLFYGPWSRVELYASEELEDWFRANGRLTYAEFEDQYSSSTQYDDHTAQPEAG